MTKFLLSLCTIATFAVASAFAQADSTSATGSAFSKAEMDAIVAFHNKVRKEVGAPPIEWSQELAARAQEWADYLAKMNKFEHRPHSGKYAQKYGENIAGAMSEQQGVEACKMWYSEKKFYKGGKLTGANWYKSGHYTQMVWGKTTKIGLGKAKGKRWAIIVGNYDPAGNMMGEKPY